MFQIGICRLFPFRGKPQIYLWLAISIFGAANSVTRKLTEIGARHFQGDRNPISLCNVLFVGNLCTLLVLLIIHWRQVKPAMLKRLSRQEWLGLIVVATSLVSSFTPIASILAAYFILGEVPTLAQYIGGSVIVLGVFLSQIGKLLRS